MTTIADPSDTVRVRPARDGDGDAIGYLIARCWADYPGSYFDHHGEMADLDRIASVFAAKGGLIWAAVLDDRIVGSIGAAPVGAGAVGGAWELTKMYVDPLIRRRSIGRLLLGVAEAHAAAAGAGRIVLWTDTRFETAHRFYERLGYLADGRTRALADLSNSVEYFYAKRLGG